MGEIIASSLVFAIRLRSGLIGRSWSMIFASAGYSVSLYDLIAENVDAALDDIDQQLKTLEAKGLLRGTTSASQQRALISKSSSLRDCLAGAIHCQVCAMHSINLLFSISINTSWFDKNVSILISTRNVCLRSSN